MRTHHGELCVETKDRYQFVDLTDRIIDAVEMSGVSEGMVNVQTRHTTTAIVVNENEPWLLDDMRDLFNRVAPPDGPYRHNDCPPEYPEAVHDNGHSHCKAMILGMSEMLNISNGAVQLGQWQRIFLVELDKPRRRSVSVMVMGDHRPACRPHIRIVQ